MSNIFKIYRYLLILVRIGERKEKHILNIFFSLRYLFTRHEILCFKHHHILHCNSRRIAVLFTFLFNATQIPTINKQHAMNERPRKVSACNMLGLRKYCVGLLTNWSIGMVHLNKKAYMNSIDLKNTHIPVTWFSKVKKLRPSFICMEIYRNNPKSRISTKMFVQSR